jgi:hypothetical protein
LHEKCLLYKKASILIENICRKVDFKKGESVMVRSIDMKSALIGGLVVALFLCLVGAVYYVPPEDFGWFKIEVNDGHAFVLDSATGQVWSEPLVYPEGGIRPIEPDPNFFAPKTYPITWGSQ